MIYTFHKKKEPRSWEQYRGQIQGVGRSNMHATHTGTNLDWIKTARNLNHFRSRARENIPHCRWFLSLIGGSMKACVKMPLSKPNQTKLSRSSLFVGIRSWHNKYTQSNPGFRVPVLVESPILLFGDQIDRRAGDSARKNSGAVLLRSICNSWLTKETAAVVSGDRTDGNKKE
jgi:hypothetical protein